MRPSTETYRKRLNWCGTGQHEDQPKVRNGESDMVSSEIKTRCLGQASEEDRLRENVGCSSHWTRVNGFKNTIKLEDKYSFSAYMQ